MKTLKWIGSSKKDLKKLPKKVQESIIFALNRAQEGKKYDHAKRLKGIKAIEIIERDKSGTYRAVYTTEIKNTIYVLHVFQKKSKKGIKTPIQEINLIKQRLKEVKKLKQVGKK